MASSRLSVAGTVCTFYYLQGSLAGPAWTSFEKRHTSGPPQEWSFLALGGSLLNVLACVGIAGFFIALPAYFMGATFPLWPRSPRTRPGTRREVSPGSTPPRYSEPDRSAGHGVCSATGSWTSGPCWSSCWRACRSHFVCHEARGYSGRMLYRLARPPPWIVVFVIFPGRAPLFARSMSA